MITDDEVREAVHFRAQFAVDNFGVVQNDPFAAGLGLGDLEGLIGLQGDCGSGNAHFDRFREITAMRRDHVDVAGSPEVGRELAARRWNPSQSGTSCWSRRLPQGI